MILTWRQNSPPTTTKKLVALFNSESITIRNYKTCKQCMCQHTTSTVDRIWLFKQLVTFSCGHKPKATEVGEMWQLNFEF